MLEKTPGKRGLKVYHDLFSFYRSKEWRKLLEVLKMERVDDQGQLICASCEKPIVKAYDAIGHHKIELTEDNVNDANVSLNPDNVELVHHKCHNILHNKLGYGQREIFLVYGPPLAGKRSWVRDNMSEGDLIIDLDDIWQCVSGCERYVKPGRLKAVAFKVRDALIEAVRYRQGKWLRAYVVGGYPLTSDRERLCKELGAREVYVEATREECIRRVEAMQELNAEEWTRYVDEWFERYNPPHGAD